MPAGPLIDAHALTQHLEALGPNILVEADRLARQGFGDVVTYSPKVFIPVTRLCRDVCAYCTFARTPRQVAASYMSVDDVLAVARAGQATGCHEALFTLGDKPELRYPSARRALDAMGFASTVDYVAHLCEIVLNETGLLPHVNAGVLDGHEMAKLRKVSVSQGLMLEQATDRLGERGGPHYGSPDKLPQRRLQMIEEAGRLAIPFTSGILIGIGETRSERIHSLTTLRDVHRRHGHLQEIIVQNFRAKDDTRMAGGAEPDLDDVMWTAAAARLIFGPDMNIQVPPNLSFADFPRLLEAGINDWGGISPVTPDHVNPEAPWPERATLRTSTEAAGGVLLERLPIYPAYCKDISRWVDAGLRPHVLRAMDTDGYARADAWAPGLLSKPPATRIHDRAPSAGIARIIARARRSQELSSREIEALFRARGADEQAVLRAADDLREDRCGSTVSYAVNRNINYTNVCQYSCHFCAFSKGRGASNLRGAPYDLNLDEIVRRAREAWQRGATEVCMQGGIHPDYSGHTYLTILRAIKDELPDLHIHAFSPLEVSHGARSLGIGVADFLKQLREAGLGSLPGTAAEILVDDVRAVICPEKLSSEEWIDIVRTAHQTGLPTTSTIMFGHVDNAGHWARHLLALRRLQHETGGITEFVPLPFVHMEAPLYHRGQSRKGPTFREAILMIAVARLALNGAIDNIQASWVKLGRDGTAAALAAGANDLGGTLMNESISRAAGTQHGQEFPPQEMESFIRAAGRTPLQRTTLYGEAAADRRHAAQGAAPLEPIQLTRAGKFAHIGSRALRLQEPTHA